MGKTHVYFQEFFGSQQCKFNALYKTYMTVKHTYLFTNYTHSDMFQLERVIIRLSIEPYIRYIKC